SFGFDNKLYYENNDMKVEIKDCSLWLFTCLIDGETLGTAELKSHSSVDEIVRYGYGAEETVMYYDFEGWDLYENGLGEVIFTDERTGKIIEKDYYFVEWISYQVEITDYDNSCAGLPQEELSKCTPNILGTHMETRWRWERLKTKDIKNTRIGIKTYVGKNDYIDAVWTIAGKEITKHASWTAGLNVGLDIYYKLDEEVNGTVIDSTDNNNGTNDGVIVNVTGIIGTAYDIEQDDSLEVHSNTNTGITGTDARSLSVWIKRESDGAIVQIAGGGVANAFELFGMGIQTAGNEMYFQGGGAADYNTGQAITADATWHHVVVAYDGAKGYTYFDGNPTPTTAQTIALITPDDKLWVGGIGSLGSEFDGFIDEVGFWSRNISQAEITDLYNGGTGITFTTEFPPIITLNSPVDFFNSSSQTIIFNYTATVGVGKNITNVTLFIDGIENITTINNTDNNITITTELNLSEGNHTWNVTSSDSSDLVGTSETRNLTIDSVSPLINITFPTGQVDYQIVNTNLTLNWTVSDLNLDSCLYDYNTTNISITCADNTTQFNVTIVNNRNLTFYANDTFGNENSTTINWGYKIFQNSLDFNSETIEGNLEEFTLNITITNSSLQISTVNLFYNGTDNFGSFTSVGDEEILTESINIPSVTAERNLTFLWIVTLSDGSIINTTSNNQSVSNIGIDNCTSNTNLI
ncbi:hypothetical protein LCGC14_2077590, partial [marine sediment metagenome]